VHSQALVGIGAIVAILLSMMAGYGTSFLAGIPMSNIALILPFVLVGIGLDDTFILTGEYALTDKKDSIYDRFGQMIIKGGAAITITTTTNILAFGIGSSSTIPAIQWFCIYAALSVLFGYFLQITFVVACMFLDDLRIEKRRYDCLICVTAADSYEPNTSNSETSLAKKCIGKYTEFILRPKVKISILFLFSALFVASLVGVTFVEEGFNPLDLLQPIVISLTLQTPVKS